MPQASAVVSKIAKKVPVIFDGDENLWKFFLKSADEIGQKTIFYQ